MCGGEEGGCFICCNICFLTSDAGVSYIATHPPPLHTHTHTHLQAPEVQIHEPYLVTTKGAGLQSEAQAAYTQLSAAGLPIQLVTGFDDLGAAYPWVVALPVAGACTWCVPSTCLWLVGWLVGCLLASRQTHIL